MATSYTSLLGLALPVTGELAGTWGDTVNNSITSLLDTAVAGTTTLSTDADVTLTTTTGASNQARQAILLCSGARTALRTITAPAQSKIYVVINSTTGGFGVKLVGVGPTTGVTVAAGKTAVLVWNGSDFVEVAPATATTATNLAGGAAGSLPYQSGVGATTFLSIGAANFVLTSTGTAPTWTANTGTGSVVRATSPTLVTPLLGTPTSGTLTNCTDLPIATGVSGLGANVATFLATPSSANLAAAVTDETGSGSLVFGTSPTLATPTFTTSATFPLHIGGTGTTSTLTLRSTSGVGTTGADIIFQTGNNGATEAMRVLNSGNVGIGTTSPTNTLSVTGSANITGNTTLGDASTDTVTVNGYMGVGGAGQAAMSVYARSNALTGSSQGGFYADIVGSSAATAEISGFRSSIRTEAAAFTVADLSHFRAFNAAKGAGSTITNQHGLYVADQTQGTNNYGITSLVSSGTNKWNIYASGTAANYFAGTVLIGTTTQPTGVGLNVASTLRIGNSNGGTLQLEDTDVADASAPFFVLQSESSAFKILSANRSGTGTTGSTERLRIDSAGNVGIGTTTPVNKLQVNGSLGRNAPVTKTASFTLADTENWLICNGTGTITVTLPAASSWTGREVMIKTIAAFTVVSASSNVVPLAGGAAGTAILAATAGKFATLVSDGTNWIIMQAN